jgi:hypothetical protein
MEVTGQRSFLVESFGQDGDYVRHVSIWESKARKDRYVPEPLILVFQSFGMVAEVRATTEFTSCEAESHSMR